MNHVLALDVGGTGMKAALMAPDGTLSARAQRATGRERGPQAVVAGVLEFTAQLCEAARAATGRAPVAAGVAVPGTVDECRGTALYSANLGWRDVPIRDLLAERLKMPVTLSHDLRAGGVAEGRLGAARGHDRFVFLALGTGVAAAIGIDGRIEAGAHARAGELGHVVVRPGGLRCGCGARGCLETLASASAVARAYTAAGGGDGATAQEVAGAVERGEEPAVAVWAAAVEALADGIMACAAVLDPGVFVVGGGLALAGETLFAPLRAAVARRVTFHAPPVVRPAALGAAAACVGAGLLARDRLEREQPARQHGAQEQPGGGTAGLHGWAVGLVRPGGPFHTLPTALDRPLLFVAGGVPAHRDGRLIGALRVGGGTPAQDHPFATVALAALPAAR